GIITGTDVKREMRSFPVGVPAPVAYYPVAIEKVRFVGEPVAVVVADSRYIAEDAVERISVDYELLSPVMDVEAALKPDSPLLHEAVGSNIANHRTFSYGDWERTLAEAPHVISSRFEFPKTTAT